LFTGAIIFTAVEGGKTMHLFKGVILAITTCLIFMLVGCSPEVGSDEWCKDMQEKPKGDWTASETADYAKHCIIR
jgi:hypothetical protein